MASIQAKLLSLMAANSVKNEKYTNLQQIKTKGKRAKYISIKYKYVDVEHVYLV